MTLVDVHKLSLPDAELVCAEISLPLTCRACQLNNRGLGAIILAEDEVQARLGAAIDHAATKESSVTFIQEFIKNYTIAPSDKVLLDQYQAQIKKKYTDTTYVKVLAMMSKYEKEYMDNLGKIIRALLDLVEVEARVAMAWKVAATDRNIEQHDVKYLKKCDKLSKALDAYVNTLKNEPRWTKPGEAADLCFNMQSKNFEFKRKAEANQSGLLDAIILKLHADDNLILKLQRQQKTKKKATKEEGDQEEGDQDKGNQEKGDQEGDQEVKSEKAEGTDSREREKP